MHTLAITSVTRTVLAVRFSVVPGRHRMFIIIPRQRQDVDDENNTTTTLGGGGANPVDPSGWLNARLDTFQASVKDIRKSRIFAKRSAERLQMALVTAPAAEKELIGPKLKLTGLVKNRMKDTRHLVDDLDGFSNTLRQFNKVSTR